jgi:hypothetical protein
MGNWRRCLVLFAALDRGFRSSISCSSATTEPSALWELIVAQLFKCYQPCVDSEGLWSCSQIHITDLYSEPNESSLHVHALFKTHLNIKPRHPSMSVSSKWSLTFRFSDQNCICISVVPHVTCPAHLTSLIIVIISYESNYTVVTYNEGIALPTSVKRRSYNLSFRYFNCVWKCIILVTEGFCVGLSAF